MKESRDVVRWIVLVASLVLVAGLAVALGACGSEEETTAAEPSPAALEATTFDGTVADALADNADLSSFAEAAAASGMAETLAGTGPFTVFAPGNAAVEEAAASLDEAYVKAAAVEGSGLTEEELRAVTENDSMLEDNKVITIVGKDDGLYANSIKVVEGPIECTNGMIYVLDGVIAPKD
jgi:transforming growth factor-beta-induced protein